MSNCITGWGSADTHALELNDGRPNTHTSAGKPYQTINFQQVYDMLVEPPTVDKDKAQWFIPSMYHDYDGRSHATQRERGQYCWLAADIDKGSPTLANVVDAVRLVLPSVGFAVYASRSSTESNLKWRVLVPLGTPIPGKHYGAYQASFFDAMELAGGLTLDRALERTGQVVYLPNRGEFYTYHIEPSYNLFTVESHPQLTKRAQDYIQAQEASAANQANPKTGPFISSFTAKYSIAGLLTKYGYINNPGTNHYRSPYQESKGYGTQDRGDHWLSLSWSDADRGLGKPTVNGSRYGDAFDLYVHYEHAGDFAKAVASIKDDVYGDASSGVLINFTDSDGEFHAIWPKPDRLPGNGYDLMMNMFDCIQRQKETAAMVRLAEVHEHTMTENLAKKAEERKWSGDWVKEVPFKLVPSELEWLAWHAPGAIGMAVRARSHNTARLTLVPLMVGATMAIAHFGQGKVVSKYRQHYTPSALMMFVVGGSGSGKNDSSDMFYELLNLVDRSRIKASKTKTFASGQSLTDYLMHHNSDVIMIQNESGAHNKAGKGTANFDSLIAGVTDAFTSFKNGIEITHTKSDEKTAKMISHPTVCALMSSTPRKLFSAIDASDAESGWLGRNLFIQIPSTETNFDVKPVKWPEDLLRVVNWAVNLLPPLAGNIHPDVWQSPFSQAFHLLQYTSEAMALMDEMTHYCDEITGDLRRSDSEAAIYSRATEAVNRLATVCGLAKGGLVIDTECVEWSIRVVKQSLALVTSKMENMVTAEDNDTPASMAREAIRKFFKSAENSQKEFDKWGTGATRGPSGEVLIATNALRRRVKDNTKVRGSDASAEIKGMLEDGELLSIPSTNLVVWLRYIG